MYNPRREPDIRTGLAVALSQGAWTLDRQGPLGVGRWGDCVLWDVRVHWQGAPRQCRSGFGFGYRQTCCSCIEGGCDKRGSCNFVCGSRVPAMPFPSYSESVALAQLLSSNLLKVFAHNFSLSSLFCNAGQKNTTLSKLHGMLDTLVKWLQSHELELTSFQLAAIYFKVLSCLVRWMDQPLDYPAVGSAI